MRRVSRTLAEEADRALIVTLMLGLLLLLISTVVLRLGYRAPVTHHHLSIEDAVYFTVETVATVGFGDFSFATQPAWLEGFGILLIVAGTTLVTTIFALLTNVLVSRRIEQSLGQGSIRGMEDHVVLVGLGAVGLRVLEGLRALGRAVVVVEYDERNRYVQHARSLGVPIVHGDATLGQTLRSVNIAEAGAVAILTSDDLVNLETGLAVRDSLGERWAEVPVVLRHALCRRRPGLSGRPLRGAAARARARTRDRVGRELRGRYGGRLGFGGRRGPLTNAAAGSGGEAAGAAHAPRRSLPRERTAVRPPSSRAGRPARHSEQPRSRPRRCRRRRRPMCSSRRA